MTRSIGEVIRIVSFVVAYGCIAEITMLIHSVSLIIRRMRQRTMDGGTVLATTSITVNLFTETGHGPFAVNKEAS